MTRTAPRRRPIRGGFVVANSTGTFAQYNGTFGLITDINNALQPLNTPFSLPNFITFNLNNNETVELMFIPLGSKTQSMTCAGLMDCTPAGIPGLINPMTNPTGASAFNLDKNLSGTVASFGVAGTIRDATTGLFGEITGTISSNLDGLNPEQALVKFAGAGPAGLPLTYSGQFIINSVIPEPATLALTGAGLLGLGLLRRWAAGITARSIVIRRSYALQSYPRASRPMFGIARGHFRNYTARRGNPGPTLRRQIHATGLPVLDLVLLSIDSCNENVHPEKLSEAMQLRRQY